MSPARRSLRFPRSRRLSGRRAFAAVFEAKVRKNAGPLHVYGRPNGLDHPRLGLSVGRPVGIAVQRNLIKRRLREAFRLTQHDWPSGLDVVVVVRTHVPASLADYQGLLLAAVRALHLEVQRRQRQGH